MPGKRKREGPAKPLIAPPPRRQLSAIAAARLKAEATVKGILTPELTCDPVPVPSISPISASSSESGESHGEQHRPSPERVVKLCSWRNDQSDILSETETALTIRLDKHATVALVGCFDLRILKGAVHINGANIGTLGHTGQKHQLYRVYVPATHPLFKIRGLDVVNHVQFITCAVPTPLANIPPVFTDIWTAAVKHAQGRSFEMVTLSHADSSSRPLIPDLAPGDWLRAIEDCTSNPSVTLVTGPSDSGKSVFTKRLLNRHLTGLGKTAPPATSAFLLDLNPDKQEYTPTGQISLVSVKHINLSPAYTHPTIILDSEGTVANRLIRAHPMPVSLANYMEYFQQCIEDLYLTYKSLQSRDDSIPLVIDTSGMLYTTAFDVLIKLSSLFRPHHIVHLSGAQAFEPNGASKLHLLQKTASSCRGTVHDITAQGPPLRSMRSAAQLRTMQMQSYFHLNTGKTRMLGSKELGWAHTPVSRLVPWELCYQDTPERSQDIVGFASYAEPVEAASLAHVLMGSIVHIVQSTSSSIPTPYTSLQRTGKFQIPYFGRNKRTGTVPPLDPRTINLVCVAIVRNFDPERKVMRLVVPSAHEDSLRNLAPERTVLISGCCEMPEWAFLESASLGQQSREQVEHMCDDDQVECLNWVEDKSVSEAMGYLEAVRRVRRFQT
ncbi:Polynucleotide 5'-hydroxyl-kinase grc3 [Coniothyrium glycines]